MMQTTRVNSSHAGVTTNITITTTQPPLQPPPTVLSKDELTKREFYATYDVMTGIRIAATLGTFFGLMVILVVYKSKSKTQKALTRDPHLAAVAAEAVAEAEADLEEEELALQAALEATANWTMNPRAARHARQSLGNMSAPTSWARSPRFSSVGGGGYANLLTPPTRPYGKSLPGSAYKFYNHSITGACNEMDDDDDTLDELDDFHFLNINKRNYRRCSNITCSSSDSSYLERRGSAVVGLPLPPGLPNNRRRRSAEKCWDFYYPIDIQVIQPTPNASPCGSEKLLYDQPPGSLSSEVTSAGLVIPSRLAPLATISSCASSVLCHDLGSDNTTSQRSLGSDSVFMDDHYYDTDDEVTPFSTDSSESSIEFIVPSSPFTPKEYAWKRTLSAPVHRRAGNTRQQRLIKHAESTNLLNSRSADSNRLLEKSSQENIQLVCCRQTKSAQVLGCVAETSLRGEEIERPACPVPEITNSETSTLIGSATNQSIAPHLENIATITETINRSYTTTDIPRQYSSSSLQILRSSSAINLDLGSSKSQETLF